MSEWGDKFLTEADNARLRAENDKLRVELTDLSLKSCPSCGIKVENEKLRELVDYMTPIAWYGASERERDRMCELGIEVDE